MISRLSDTEVVRLRSVPLTYRERGGTRGDLPLGYQTVRVTRTLGTGSAAFAAATAALLTWAMHDRAGLAPQTDTAEIVEGSVAMLRFGLGWLSVPIPVRVVYVVDEPRRRGFAYGTLPGHPEQGEESFVIEWRADDAVVATITAFTRPGRWYTRAGGPVARAIQRRATERYLSALHAAIRGRSPRGEDPTRPGLGP